MHSANLWLRGGCERALAAILAHDDETLDDQVTALPEPYAGALQELAMQVDELVDAWEE
mgnify:CR=1 FL=1